MKESCSICKFFIEDKCRRYPPRRTSYPERDIFQPSVSENMWCGEFKRRVRI